MQRVSFVAKVTIRQYAMIVQLPICNAPEKRLCTFLLAMMHFLEVSFGKNHIFVPKSVEFSARIRADFDVFVAGIAKLKEEKDAQSSKFAVRHLKCIFFRKATEGELFLSSPFFFSASKIGVSEVCGVIFRSSLDHLLAAAKL